MKYSKREAEERRGDACKWRGKRRVTRKEGESRMNRRRRINEGTGEQRRIKRKNMEKRWRGITNKKKILNVNETEKKT